MGLENTLQAELELIVIEWSLMTLDISVEFFNHTLSLFRFAPVHLHSYTSKRHILHRRAHTHTHKQTDGINDEHAN